MIASNWLIVIVLVYITNRNGRTSAQLIDSAKFKFHLNIVNELFFSKFPIRTSSLSNEDSINVCPANNPLFQFFNRHTCAFSFFPASLERDFTLDMSTEAAIGFASTFPIILHH